MRQSLNRRKPTRCRLNYKKQNKVVLYYKVISEQKSAPLTLSLIKCNPAKSVAILRQKNLSRTICRGEQCSPVLRVCCKFRIVGENFFAAEPCCCRGLITSTSEHRSPVLKICCKFRIVGENFLLPNLVVAVGLFLRRANGVRPYTYIELIPQVE